MSKGQKYKIWIISWSAGKQKTHMLLLVVQTENHFGEQFYKTHPVEEARPRATKPSSKDILKRNFGTWVQRDTYKMFTAAVLVIVTNCNQHKNS